VLFVVFLLVGIFSVNDSIRAQIGNIYDQKNDQVAGISALMSAVTANDVVGVKFFSKAGVALVNQKNFGGATSLHIACREKNFEIVKILIDNGADVNVVDNEGWTPLMRAALTGDNDIVNLLLQNGAQANSINSIGESAIIHATTADCDACLNSMFEKFNFLLAMDVKLLKEQLTNAFIIAKNRDNEVVQASLENYLDRLIKMSPLMQQNGSIDDGAILRSVDKAQQKSGKKIFKLISPDGNVSSVAESEVPMIASQQDKRSAVQSESKDDIIVHDLKNIPTTKLAKKFKFISGAEKSIQPIYYVKIRKKEVPKITESSSSNDNAKEGGGQAGKSDDSALKQGATEDAWSEKQKSPSQKKFKFVQGPSDVRQ